MREKGSQYPGHRKIAREVESEVGSPGRDWGMLNGDELMVYHTTVGLGTISGEHLLAVIPCIDGGPPLGSAGINIGRHVDVGQVD